mgnify:CR=1 FL=1
MVLLDTPVTRVAFPNNIPPHACHAVWMAPMSTVTYVLDGDTHWVQKWINKLDSQLLSRAASSATTRSASTSRFDWLTVHDGIEVLLVLVVIVNVFDIVVVTQWCIGPSFLGLQT